jgi:hypothetical protein
VLVEIPNRMRAVLVVWFSSDGWALRELRLGLGLGLGHVVGDDE